MSEYANKYQITDDGFNSLSLITANGKSQIAANNVTLTSQQVMSLRYQGYFLVGEVKESLGLCCTL